MVQLVKSFVWQLDMVVTTCNPRIGKAETGGYPGFTSLPVRLIAKFQVQRETPSPNKQQTTTNKVDKRWGKMLKGDLCDPRAHPRVCTFKHTCTLMYMNTHIKECTLYTHTHTNVCPPELAHNAVEFILPAAATHPFTVFSLSLPPPTRTLELWSQLQHPLVKEPTQYLSVCAWVLI